MKIAVIVFGLSLYLGLSSFKNKEASALEAEMNTNTISGLIVDKTTGETLVGVEVQIEGTDLKTYTDFDGKFNFDNLKSGKYTISTKYISYTKECSKELYVNKNELHSLNLELKQVDKK